MPIKLAPHQCLQVFDHRTAVPFTPDALVSYLLRSLELGISAPSPFSSTSFRSRGFPSSKDQENCGTSASRSKGRLSYDQLQFTYKAELTQ
jgi:hypothetical protein